MEKKLYRSELLDGFMDATRNSDCTYLYGANPFRIKIYGSEYHIYIKNLSSAYFSNPDVSRVQLPIRDAFNDLISSAIHFVLLGYDANTDVYAAWNPSVVKQRLNKAESVSFYSRWSLQADARTQERILHRKLNNDLEVIAFPREKVTDFLADIGSYFVDDGIYVAIGSKKRKEANETYKQFINPRNIAHAEKCMAENSYDKEEISLFSRTLRQLLKDGTLRNNRKFFLAFDNLEGYFNNLKDFLSLPDISAMNVSMDGKLGEVLEQYLLILQLYGVDSGSTEKGDSGDENEPDWEATFTDAHGKLTRITNPALLDAIRPYLDTTYRNLATAYNIICDFYDGRYGNMTLSDWGKLINAIDWTNPYYINSPEPTILEDSYRRYGTRSPRRKIRVTFPNGKFIQPAKVYEALVTVVEYAEPEKVRDLQLTVNNDNLVLNAPHPKYSRACKPVCDGWFVNTGTDTNRKFELIQEISTRLGLGLNVELV